MDEVCSVLVKEPFNLSMGEIAQLTDYQLEHVYFRPERKPGQKWLPSGAEPVSAFYVFWHCLRRSGLSDAEVLERWKAERPGRKIEAVISPAWEAPRRGR